MMWIPLGNHDALLLFEGRGRQDEVASRQANRVRGVDAMSPGLLPRVIIIQVGCECQSHFGSGSV